MGEGEVGSGDRRLGESSSLSRAEGCRRRQARFRTALIEHGIDAAILTQRRHLNYLFALQGWRAEPAAAIVFADGRSVVAAGASADVGPIADEVVRYADAQFATLRDDRETLALAAIEPKIAGVINIGRDIAFAGDGSRTVIPILTAMRRRKDPDELALIGAAIAATETGYRAVASLIRPGLSELELFAAFLSASTIAAGEPIGELGNDFRGGAPGGRPRQMPLLEGDLLPLDAGVEFRGYHADLCRTFAVGGVRNSLQKRAFRRVEAALAEAETMIGPGTSCRSVYEAIAAQLDGWEGWRFGHQLGHGIGLSPHEAPRLNPHWDDVFAEGDVFTLEPGLYGDDLRAGIRLEQDYAILDGRLQRLSNLPLDLPV